MSDFGNLLLNSALRTWRLPRPIGAFGRPVVAPQRVTRLRGEWLEDRCLLAFSAVAATVAPISQAEVISFGDNWKYLDNGSNQGTAWRSTGFNDAAWAQGPAELGYGDGDEATTVGYGGNASNKYVTTYFRRAFTLSDPASITTLDLSVIRDDGVAVYLNGVELLRNNLAAGATYTTLATTAISGTDESTPVWATIDVSTLPPGTLVSGTNVLAAEMHQSAVNSSDISFDLALTARGNPLQLTVDFNAAASAATLQAADLVINGSLTATQVTLVNPYTAVFTLPSLSGGSHTATIAGGAVQNTTQEGISPLSHPFTLGATPQYVLQHTPRLQLGNAPLAGYPGGDQDQVELLWQTIPGGTGTQDTFQVEYRPSGTLGPWTPVTAVSPTNTGVGGRVVHANPITGLNWDADYEYRVRHLRAGVLAAAYQHTFHTRLPAGDPTSFAFAAYGDSAAGNAAGFRAVQARINQLDPAFAVLLGDNVYEAGSHAESDLRFHAKINPEAAEWIAGHIDYLGLGNHDVATGSGQPSEHNFSVPIPVAGVNASHAPPATERAEHNFSWDYGDVHFVTFDTNALSNPSRLDGLLDYVVADLTASNARWKIVYGHHPVAGVPDKPESPADYYYQQVVPRLKNAGADLFLVGHSHTYSWTYPLTGQVGGLATYVAGPYDDFQTGAGLPQLVSGVGGKDVRSGSFSQFPFVAAGYTSTTATPGRLGFTLVEVTPGALTLSYLAADNGAVIDAFTIHDDAEPPAANLVAPAHGGSIAQATLNSRGYLDVTFSDTGGSGLDPATITDAGAELSLSGSGAGTAALSGAATLVSGTTYRYAFTGSFGAGTVNVKFLAGSFADLAGNPNSLEAESFTALGPTVVQVVDNSQAGFAIVSGSWSTGSVGYLGNNRHNVAGTGADKARWTFSGLPAGQYRVSVTWPAGSNRATNSPFTVLSGTTPLATVPINQELTPNDFSALGVGWEDLGGPHTITGSTLVVELTDQANEYVIADAVRIERIGNLPESLIVSISPASFLENAGTSPATGTVTRSGSIAESLVVTLTSSDTGEAAVPATVTIPAGQDATTFSVAAVDDTLADGTQTLTVTATAAGYSSGSTTLSVLDDEPPAFTQVIDNSQTGFTIVSGSWGTGSVGYLGNNRHNVAGTGADKARWTFSGLPAGQYRVAATWPEGTNRATNSPFTVFQGTTLLATVPINQELAPNDFNAVGMAWENVGGAYDISGSTLVVELTDQANEYVVADAIRIERIGILPETISVSVTPSSFLEDAGTNAATGTVTRSGSTAGALVVALFSSDTTEAAVPATVTIPIGQPSATFLVHAVDDVLLDATQTVTITGSAPGFLSGSTTVSVLDDELPAFSQVIDNSQAGFTIVSGSWGTGPVGYLGNNRHNVAGTGADKARWTFTGLSPGQYRVAATWPEGTNRATNSPFTVFQGTTPLATVPINQELAPNDFSALGVGWEDLGGPYTITGSTLVVELTDQANEYVIADAIRIEKIESMTVSAADLPPPALSLRAVDMSERGERPRMPEGEASPRTRLHLQPLAGERETIPTRRSPPAGLPLGPRRLAGLAPEAPPSAATLDRWFSPDTLANARRHAAHTDDVFADLLRVDQVCQAAPDL